jgi:hypothetical protein
MVPCSCASDKQQTSFPLQVLLVSDRINVGRRDRGRCRHDSVRHAYNRDRFIPCMVLTRTAFFFDLLPSSAEGMPAAPSASAASLTR